MSGHLLLAFARAEIEKKVQWQSERDDTRPARLFSRHRHSHKAPPAAARTHSRATDRSSSRWTERGLPRIRACASPHCRAGRRTRTTHKHTLTRIVTQAARHEFTHARSGRAGACARVRNCVREMFFPRLRLLTPNSYTYNLPDSALGRCRGLSRHSRLRPKFH